MKIEFDAASAFAALDRAKGKLEDLTPVYQDVASYMVKATRDRFVSGTAPDGTRWRQKAPTTLAEYVRRGDGNRPKPLIGPSGRLSREVLAIVNRTGAEIGSSLEYAGTMQFGAARGAFGTTKRGGPVPWGDIPARTWLGVSAEDERSILDIVGEHLANVLDEQ